MQEFVDLVASWVLTTVAIFWIVREDERRLSPHRLNRAWPLASRLSAIVVFGVFALPVHFWRTRRSVVGVLKGLLWFFALIGLQYVIAEAVERLVPD